jgi:hypothetical protein
VKQLIRVTAATTKQRLEPPATTTTDRSHAASAWTPREQKLRPAAGVAILGSLAAGAAAIERAEGAGWDAAAIALFAAIALWILSFSSRAVHRRALRRPRQLSNPNDLA